MPALRLCLIATAMILAAVPASPPAGAQTSTREISTNTGSVTVERHQGRLIRLTRPAASVFIANPDIADISVKSTRMVYVFGKTPGRTTLFAVDAAENVVADLDITVTHDLSGLEQAIGTLLPAGGIDVTSVNGAIVLSGNVATASEAENVRRLAARFVAEGEEVINRLEVTEPNQVNLRVRIAEVSRSAMRDFGFNFDIFEGDFRFTSGDTFLQNPGPLNGIGTFALTGNPVGVGLLSGGTLGSATINALVDALEEVGMAKTLAEPNLTALSGETASFLAGGEFPIPVSQDKDSISIEFKEFGVSLAFTPTLLNSSRISMRVRPEVSQLSNAGSVTIGGINISALTTRRAETTIELASGQSFAIAGLLQEDFQDTVRQMPYLGNVPILGELFKSEEFRRNETELIIIVTPYVVKPMTADDTPLPTEPLTRARPELSLGHPAAGLSGPIPAQLPPGTDQTGSAKYILD